jgi:hypothetical protein
MVIALSMLSKQTMQNAPTFVCADKSAYKCQRNVYQMRESLSSKFNLQLRVVFSTVDLTGCGVDTVEFYRSARQRDRQSGIGLLLVLQGKLYQQDVEYLSHMKALFNLSEAVEVIAGNDLYVLRPV